MVIFVAYTIAMVILSAVINFLWKKNIIEFTDNTKKIGIFEKFIKLCLDFSYC